MPAVTNGPPPFSTCSRDLFDRDKIVYLSADSNRDLKEYNPGYNILDILVIFVLTSLKCVFVDDVYVLGGLFDGNGRGGEVSGFSLRKAEADGVRHARLPLTPFLGYKNHLQSV